MYVHAERRRTEWDRERKTQSNWVLNVYNLEDDDEEEEEERNVAP